MQTQPDSYWSSVIDPGDRASKYAKEVCFRSHRNSKLVHIVPHQPSNFRGPVGFVWRKDIAQKLADFDTDASGAVTRWCMAEEVEDDGAGGKPQFFTFLGEWPVFYGLGWEVICMVADDFSRTGRRPVVFDNEINAKRITDKNFPLFKAMIDGFGDALAKAELVNITGEVAVMKHCITAFCDASDDSQLILTWGGSCVGLCDREKLIDPSRIVPGMSVIALHEQGYRCNGGTFFTNVILSKWGKDIRALFENTDVRAFVRQLTAPSICYTPLISRLVGWTPVNWGSEVKPDIAGIAHITGGGIMEKFKEMLPKGVGAELEQMPEPPVVLRKAQELSQDTPYRLSDWEAHRTLHGGCGMLIVCAPESEATILKEATALGVGASKAGITIKSERSEVLISSRFLKGGKLSSEHPE